MKSKLKRSNSYAIVDSQLVKFHENGRDTIRTLQQYPDKFKWVGSLVKGRDLKGKRIRLLTDAEARGYELALRDFKTIQVIARWRELQAAINQEVAGFDNLSKVL